MDNRSYFNEIQKCKKAKARVPAYQQQLQLRRRGSSSLSSLSSLELANVAEEEEEDNWNTECEQRRLSEAEVLHILKPAARHQARHAPLGFGPAGRASAPNYHSNNMGFEFRDARHTKVVWVGKRTIKDGECCGVWDLSGQYRAITGPKRKWLFFSRVRFMDRHIADAHQYLEIRHRNGLKEHKRGPLALFEDPVLHESITVMNAVTVDAFEVIVVYTEDSQGAVKRDVVHGPTVFIPDVNQWLHVFRWHGSKGSDQYTKVPGALVFTKLRTIPDQFYINCQGVRTSDDASLTVKVMIFFQLENLELMLNSTHDPIGDFINALLADLMNFSSNHSYEQFIQCAAQLSDLDTFPVLCQRAKAVGFKIGKVVYRGYQASNQLQSLCDAAIKTRTELKLKQEEQAMKQEMKNRELKGNASRGGAERAEEQARQSHRLLLEAAEHKELLERREREHEERLRHNAELAKAELEAKRAADVAHTEYLAGLSKLGVDLTQYLVASTSKQPDKVLKVLQAGGDAGGAGGSGGGQPIQVHTNV
mmetsp:Transcript_75316/g.166406  ORF Transcript_75316/g.166406 Transcript_75316/m.166406 type:complete len:534 (-) Transcript_75316:255-1856(-)